MSNCYIFNHLKYNNGIFDNSVDITYIMTMENSNRIFNITEQLSKLKPTSNIILVINKGFKKCNKNLPINISTKDIIHCNIEIFKHAKKNNFKNILVLEDDFIYDNNIYEYQHIYNINKICNDYINDSYSLSLGSLPLLMIPYNHCLYKSIFTMATQAMIYSQKCRNKILNDDALNSLDWDIYTNLNTNKYLYYVPIITQTYPETTNQKNWDNVFGLKYLAIQGIKNNELDKKPQPGYNKMFMTFKIINFLLFIIFILILFYLLNYLKK